MAKKSPGAAGMESAMCGSQHTAVMEHKGNEYDTSNGVIGIQATALHTSGCLSCVAVAMKIFWILACIRVGVCTLIKRYIKYHVLSSTNSACTF